MYRPPPPPQKKKGGEGGGGGRTRVCVRACVCESVIFLDFDQ